MRKRCKTNKNKKIKKNKTIKKIGIINTEEEVHQKE